MPGGGGGGAQTVTNLPWGQARPLGRQTVRDVTRLAANDRLNPMPFQSGMTQDYIKDMAKLGGNNAVTNGAMDAYDNFMGANTTSGPVQLQDGVNPMDATSDYIMSKVMPQVASTFGQGGFMNSTGALQTASDAATSALAPFLSQQFNADRARMDQNAYYNSALDERNIDRGLNRDMAGLTYAPTLNAMQYGDLGAVGQAGQMRDEFVMDKRRNDADNATSAANLFSVLGGMGGQQVATGGGSGGPSLLGNIAGGGLTGIGMYGALAGNPATAPAAIPLGVGAGLLSMLA